MKEVTYLLLGTNLGDRKKNLSTARNFIEQNIGAIKSASSIYQTAAWGKSDQPAFLNQAIEVKSALPPLQLLKEILDIERIMGRVRTIKWSERLIDIDIIFFGNAVINSKELTVPHPQLQARRFALVPLSEIAPQFIHPIWNVTVSELLEQCPDELEVTLYK